MTTANVIKTRRLLLKAANSLLVYCWTGEDYHLIKSARGYIMEALSEGNDPADVQRIIDNAIPLPPTEE